MGPPGDRAGFWPRPARWPATAVRSVLLSAAVFPSPAFAALAAPPPEVTQAALVITAIALGLAGALWAIAESGSVTSLRRALRDTRTRARALIAIRDAIIGAGRESVVVMAPNLPEPVSFADGAKLLETCLTGPDAEKLTSQLDILSVRGEAFAIRVRSAEGEAIAVRGKPVGGMTALYLEREAQPDTSDLHAVLDGIPVPLWLRGPDLALRFVNRAFLAASGAASLEDALASGMALEPSERDLAASARAGETTEAKRFAVLGGHRRALALTLAPLPDGGVAGTAQDVTALSDAETRLKQHIEAHSDTLDRMATAVSIFSSDRRLIFYNRAYVRLWGLPDTWLDTHPSEGEILDRLRELRRLPEQPDFREWKQQRLKLFEKADQHPEELWHLPGGRTLRVVAQPHPLGGLSFLYEDVSDQLRMESSYNTLIKVQKATLDTLQEGVAVFGPDGRLKLHNAAFARIWRLEADELASEPHVKRIADSCARRFGQDRAWDIVLGSVTAAAPERRSEWGEVERSDGAIISLMLAPLPDGASLVSFVDVTDRFRIEAALRDRNDALEASDKLKSEFVKRISYELRTPLNSIVGFSEMLKRGLPGPLNSRQNEYIDAIVTASNGLRELINGILDLSQIEGGAMELDLQQIDLHALLKSMTDHIDEWAAKVGITIELECREDAGTFTGDARRLRQVVFNMLSNAFKFTPQGGTVTLGGEIDAEVRIFVADTGPGIAPDIMPSAFERFSAKGGAVARAGAGLGLALVNRFVELHHGWVELQSAIGEGTRVTCHLPPDAAARPKLPSQASA